MRNARDSIANLKLNNVPMNPSLETPPPQKIVHYPIHGDLNGGTLLVLGDKQAKHVVFLLGGFPDDHQVR